MKYWYRDELGCIARQYNIPQRRVDYALRHPDTPQHRHSGRRSTIAQKRKRLYWVFSSKKPSLNEMGGYPCRLRITLFKLVTTVHRTMPVDRRSEIWWSVDLWKLLVCTICGLRELGQLVGYYLSPRTPWDIRLQLRQNRKLQKPRSRCSSKQREMSSQL
jgi:hypothetical protein